MVIMKVITTVIKTVDLLDGLSNIMKVITTVIKTLHSYAHSTKKWWYSGNNGL